ncbi:MAG: hypothetical protein PUH24_07700 [Prevotellaceae bacterium]|nr:hypothetical protein [Prevotellaceae bacterium]MDY6131118.1 hypothetical protein [Prevotella sp.]
MRKRRLMALCTAAMLLPMTALAQENIRKSFDRMIESKNLYPTEKHSLEKNPQTGVKNGQLDVYDFLLKDKKAKSLLQDIREAFKKDEDKAYSTTSKGYSLANRQTTAALTMEGKNARKALSENQRTINLMYNDVDGIVVGDVYDNYIQMAFPDKDENDKTPLLYRDAYAVEWSENGKGEIEGRIIYTYAKIPKNNKTVSLNGVNLDNLKGVDWINTKVADNLLSNDETMKVVSNYMKKGKTETSEAWLSKFNLYRLNYKKAKSESSATYFATAIYKLCKNAQLLNKKEKEIIADELQLLIRESKDTMNTKLLKSANEYLQ